ncbi:MAG: non-heme iron oxygenase ferredoxin subunit [Longimicrobiales bacterium]
MAFVKAANIDEVPKRGLLDLEVEGEKIVLITTGDGGYYALKDQCSHEDYPLSDGELMDDDERVECIYHGAKFNVKTGKAVALPAIRPVPSYEVKVEDGEILVDLG